MASSDYFVGQVADLLGSGKKKKKEKLSPSNSKLANLFAVKEKESKKQNKPLKEKNLKRKEPGDVSKPDTKSLHVSKKKQKDTETNKEQKRVDKKTKQTGKKKFSQNQEETDIKDVNKNEKKKKKKKTKKTEAKQDQGAGEDTLGSDDEIRGTEKSKGFCPPKGIVHESLAQKSVKNKEQKLGKRKRDDDSDNENEETKSKRRKRHKRDKTKDKRTVFIGNIPINCKKSAVKSLFAEFGKIESLRYRCPPVSDPKVPKKVTMIKKDFHPNRSNIVSFVCYEDAESAEKALKLNGHDLNGFHLRVDLACNEKKHNKTNSVFVGNIPYDIEENDVWKHFEPCGSVENVRIVRDRKTGLGKGFGYVLFQDKSSVDLALKLHCSKLKMREIRVDKCNDSQKMSKTPKNHPARQRLIKKAKRMGLKPTNLRPGETRKPRTLKKHKKSKTKDSVNKVFAAPKPMPSSNKHITFD